MMANLLFLEDKIENPGGGVQTLITMEEKLSEEHQTKFLWMDTEDREDSYNFFSRKISQVFPLEIGRLGYFLEPRLRGSLEQRISEIDPDIIFAQKRTGEIALQYAEGRDVKVVLVLHDFELLYDKEHTHRGNRLISRIVNASLRPINSRFSSRVLDGVDKIIFNSKFTAEKYGYEEKSEIIYPLIDTSKYKVDVEGEKILHVKPSKIKGIKTTLVVAEEMEDQEFLVTGSAEDEIQERMMELDNVEYVGYQEDMKDAYRKSKIVLVPSTEKETFGRIPIEAGVNGIPAIVSGKGGLKEAVGYEEFVVEENTPEAYISKIKDVERNYEDYSSKARKNAEDKDYTKFIPKLREIVEELME